MVFAHQIFEVRVGSFHLCRLAVYDLFCRDGGHRRLGDGVYVLRDDALAHSVLRHETLDVCLQRVIGEERLASEQLHDVVAYWREERLAHLTLFHAIHHIFKLFQRLSLAYPRDVAATFCRTLVVGAFRCQRREVGTASKSLSDGVDTLLCCRLLCLRGFLLQHDQDVSRAHHATRGVDAVACLDVHLPRLTLQVVGGDERWTNLLVAVCQKLFTKALRRVNACCLCRQHLQLVVYEEVDIVCHALLVYHCLGVVLVVGVFKF